MDKPRAGTVMRWLVAIAASGSGVYLLSRVLATESNWVIVFGKSLYGVALLITGILLASPELVGWALLPFYRMVDSLFLPTASEPPPVDFKLARFYATRRRYDEACEEYAKIIQYHPNVHAAYLEGIRAASLGNDPRQAKRFYRAGQRVMHSSDERKLLKSVYRAHHEPLALLDEDAASQNPSEAQPAR